MRVKKNKHSTMFWVGIGVFTLISLMLIISISAAIISSHNAEKQEEITREAKRIQEEKWAREAERLEKDIAKKEYLKCREEVNKVFAEGIKKKPAVSNNSEYLQYVQTLEGMRDTHLEECVATYKD